MVTRRCGKQGGAAHGLISAQEIACLAYCPEQWRLQSGLGLLPANTVALEAGTRHHASKALAERIAGGLGVVSGALMSRRCCCWPVPPVCHAGALRQARL